MSLSCAQISDIEARARELKARGDAAGALALLSRRDPKSARVQDEIGFLLAVLNRRAEALAALPARDRARSEVRSGALPPGRRVLAGAGSGARRAGIAGGGVARSEDLRVPLLPRQRAQRHGPLRRSAAGAEAATALNPKHAEAWNQLGLARQHTGDAAGSIEAYRRAVALDAGESRRAQQSRRHAREHRARGGGRRAVSEDSRGGSRTTPWRA